MAYQIQKLAERHREILRLILLGYPDIAIANGLGITEATVQNVKNSPVAIRHLRALQEARDASSMDVSRAIISAAPKAFAIVDKAVDSDNELGLRARDRVNAAFKLLEFAGLGAPKQQNNTINIIDGEMLTRIKNRLNGTNGMTVEDGEFVDG